MLAVILAILALVSFLLALFKAPVDFDFGILGLAFVASTLLVMNLPAWRTRP